MGGLTVTLMMVWGVCELTVTLKGVEAPGSRGVVFSEVLPGMLRLLHTLSGAGSGRHTHTHTHTK